MEIIVGLDVSFTSLMIPTTFILFFLVLINAFLQRFFKKISFSFAELITIYSMLIISVCFSAVGMSQVLVTQMANLHYYGTYETRWLEFIKYFPKYFAPVDKSAIKKFFEGGSSVPWDVWLIPTLVWGIFMFFLGFFMLCMIAIFRKSWIERERLPFPIVYLPIEMTKDSLAFLKNKVMWLGFLVPVLIEGLNGLHSVYPAIPPFPLYPIDLGSYFHDPPLKYIGHFHICFWPFVIGIAYILTTDVSFSFWFFFLVSRFNRLYAGIRGWMEEGYIGPEKRFPYEREQSVGALLGIAVFCIWTARTHLRDVFRKAVFNSPDIDDSEEPIPYRLAFFGLIVSFLFLIGFSCISGMGLKLSLIFFSMFFAYMLAFARLRAEAGTPWTLRPNQKLEESIIMMTGTTPFSLKNLAIFSFYYWMIADYSAPLTANQAESLKMQASGGIKNRKMIFLVLLLAIVMGIIVSLWANIFFYYKAGAGTGKINEQRVKWGTEAYQKLQRWVREAPPPDTTGTKVVCFSLIFTLFLTFMRTRFLWWPFHPIGYFAGISWNIEWQWFPIFIGWLLKILIIRYGGAKLYKDLLPFFLGLIIGHYFIAVFWALLGEIIGIPIYTVFG
jgi:hypothetical protein